MAVHTAQTSRAPAHIPASPDYLALSGMVRRWEWRRRVAQAIRWLPTLLLPGIGLGLVLAVVSRLRPFLTAPQIAGMALAACLIGMAVGVAVLLAWPRPLERSARRFDRLFGLNERVSTALELLGGRVQTDGSLAARQVRDAQEAARAAQVRANLPFRLDARLWALSLVAAGVLAALLLLPNPQSEAVAQEQQTEVAIEAAQDTLADITQEVAADPLLNEQTRESLLQTLDVQRRALGGENISPEEAFAALEAARAALQAAADSLQSTDSADVDGRALAEALSALNSAPGAQPPNAGTGENTAASPQAGQTAQQLAEQLAALEQALQNAAAQNPAGIPGETAQGFSGAFQGASEALSQTNPAAAQSLARAAEQIAQGEAAAAGESLQQAADQVQQAAQPPGGQSAEQAGQQGEQPPESQTGESSPQQSEQQAAQQGGQQGGQQAAQQSAEQLEQAAQQAQQAADNIAAQSQPQQSQPQPGQQGQQPGQQPGQQGSQEGQQPGEGQGSSEQGQPGQQSGAGEQAGQQPGQQPGSGASPGEAQEGNAGSQASAGQTTGGQPQPGDGGQAGESSQSGSQQGGSTLSGASVGAGAQAGDAGQNAASSAGAGASGNTPANNPDGGGQRDYAPVYAPQRIGGQGTGEGFSLEPGDPNAPTVQGNFDENPMGESVVPYNDVYADYAGAANQAMDQNRVPLGLRDLVRDYFNRLNPDR